MNVLLLKILTVEDSSTILLTHSDDSTVQARTVSVLPSLNKRVMDASYVKWCLPISRKYASWRAI